jgi:MATE family multidrug resistance protein
MLKLAAPMVVTTISFTIMQFVDRFMVSRLGTEALAAIWPAALVCFIPGGFAMGALASLNTYVSQSLGRGQKKDCSSYFWQALYMGVSYFVVVVIIMWPAAPMIFRLMGQPSGVLEMEVIYFRVMLLANVVSVVNWSFNQFFMGIHRPIITMCASLCGQVVNVIFNYLLIFGKFGFPAMGIAGAGWGTFIGMTVAGLINVYVFWGPGINIPFQSRRTLGISFNKMKDLLKVGLPSGFGLMVNVALWGVVLSALIGRFDKEALAATSAVLSYASLSVMPVVGMSMALTAAVGKLIGLGKKEQAIRQTNLCVKISMAYMGLMGVCFVLFRSHLMAFLSSDSKVIDTGVNILVCASVYQVFHAARIIYAGSLRGSGDTVWLAATSAVGAVLILGLGGFLMTVLFPSLGALGPWIAATFSVVAMGVANFWRFRSNRWMHIDLFKRRSADVPVQTEPAIE